MVSFCMCIFVHTTSNLYFLQVWNIQTFLLESVKDEDQVIKDMAKKMMVKFDKYWDEYNSFLAFRAILVGNLGIVL